MRQKITQSFLKIFLVMLFLCSSKASAMFGVTQTYEITDTTITAHWFPDLFPQNVEYYKVFHYDAAYGKYATNPWIEDGNTTSTSYTITGLMPGHSYYIRIEMYKYRIGYSDYDEYIFPIQTYSSGVCNLNPVFNVRASEITRSSARIGFNFNNNTCPGTSLDKFEFLYRKVGDVTATWTLSTAVAYPFDSVGPVLTFPTNTGSVSYDVIVQSDFTLNPGTTYSSTTFSQAASIVVTTKPPCAAPTKLHKAAGTPNSLTVEWDEPMVGSHKLRYRILSTTGTANAWLKTLTVTGTNYTITGLTAGTTYEYQVSLTCTDATGAVSDSWSALASSRIIPIPATPIGLHVNSNDVGYSKAIANWGGVSANANRYEIEVKPTTTSTWPTAVVPGGAITVVPIGATISAIIHDLLPNTVYDYRIRSVNADGFYSVAYGLPLAITPTITTLTTQPPVFDAPTVKCQAASVSWSHTQKEMTDYVRYRTKDPKLWPLDAQGLPTPGWNSAQTVLAGVTTTSDFSLTAATAYEWQVQGSWQATATTTNASGQTVTPIVGDVYIDGFKNGIDFTTPPQCVDPFLDSPLSTMPTGLTMALKNDVLNYGIFTWANGTGTTPNSYEVRYKVKRDPQPHWTLSPVTGLTYTTPALMTGEVYEWQIRSVTTINGLTYKSPFVSGSDFNTSANRMGTAIASTITNTSITIDWTTLADHIGTDLPTKYEILVKTYYQPVTTVLQTFIPLGTNSYTITGLNPTYPALYYGILIRVYCQSGTVSEWMPVISNNPYYDIVNNTILKLMCSSCDANFDAGNTRATATSISLTRSQLKSDRIESASDVDWYSFTVPIGSQNIYVALFQGVGHTFSWYPDANVYQYYNFLTASLSQFLDYDIQLYNSAGILLGSDTTNWNSTGYDSGSIVSYTRATPTTTVTTFYIKIFKKTTSSFDNQRCYEIGYEINGVGGASNKSSNINGIKTGTSTNNMVGIDGIKLIPNPATTSFTAYFNATGANKTAITVYDLLGRIVHTEEITAAEGTNSQEINTESLANGTYIVSVQTDGESKTAKLVVSH